MPKRFRPVTVAALAIILTSAASAETGGPTRQVDGNRIVSPEDPAIAVTVPQAAIYLGARRLIINDSYDAELHVYVEPDDFGLIERFYWVQFEYILPSAPDLSYDYRESNPETMPFDGVAMHVLPGGENTREGSVRPGTDYAAFRALIADAGYRLPTWITTLRLVHLPDADARKELIVIYGEGPDPLAAAAAQAMMAGAAGLRFDDLMRDLIADADARIDLTPGG